MAKYTAKQRYYRNQAKKGKITKEQAKKYGVSEKNKKSGKSSSSSKDSGKGYQAIIDEMKKSALASTPAPPKTLDEFEKTYTPAREAQDYATSEALYKPYFEKQISNQLEDLNAWNESETTSYDRSLRRARISLAAGGGAIGTERQKQEGDITKDYNKNVQDTVRGYERQVGTDKIVNAGYKSAGQNQEGLLIGKMKAAIQAGQLDFKNQAANRYMGNTKTYYSQPSGYALDGSTM